MNTTIIDCQNMPCPQPIMALLALLKQSRPTDMEVVVDNQAGLENVCRFLRSRGYAVDHAEEGALWRIRAHTEAAGADGAHASAGVGMDEAHSVEAVAGGDAADSPEASARYAGMPAAEDMPTLVMIVSPVLGSGDDELGGKLMKNFLATLPEMGSALQRIILLNGGVTLAAEGSPVLEPLRALEASGVDILVCGTCLEHFGLLAKKAVGETTNMLDVVTGMAVAYKVIRV